MKKLLMLSLLAIITLLCSCSTVHFKNTSNGNVTCEVTVTRVLYDLEGLDTTVCGSATKIARSNPNAEVINSVIQLVDKVAVKEVAQ